MALYRSFTGDVIEGLQVVAAGTPNMTVLVQPGTARIGTGTTPTNYGYFTAVDTTLPGEVVTITTANGSNPRIDVIVGYVDKAVTPSSVTPNNTNNMFKLVAVAGTPAASPVAPNGAAIQSAVGASNPYIILANVLVGTAVTSITNANITDLRTLMYPNAPGGLKDVGGISLQSVRQDTINDHFASGCLWTGDAYGSTRNASCTAGVVYIAGKRLTVAAVTARSFTASKDVYCDLKDNGDGTAIWVYFDNTTNAASPSFATTGGSLRGAIIVVGATNIASVGSINQGETNKTVPSISSSVVTVSDSIGNLIHPRLNQSLIGYRQNGAVTAVTVAQVDMTGASVTVKTQPGAVYRVSIPQYRIQNTTGAACELYPQFFMDATGGLVATGDYVVNVSSTGSSMSDYFTATSTSHTFKLRASSPGGGVNLVFSFGGIAVERV